MEDDIGAEILGGPVKFNTADPNNPSVPGDYVIMRLALVYYMRAEALARLGRDGDAKSCLNEIMVTRDPDYSVDGGLSGDALVEEILLHKRIDLWLEGERFFDLKRLEMGIDRLHSKNGEILKANYPTAYQRFVQRNSGDMAKDIPADGKSPNWEFMIPLSELDGAQGKVVQNPLHTAR